MNVIQKKLFRLQSHLSQTQYIAYGFMGIILMGSLLLMLPVSSKSGTVTPFLECLFTATSASCVTGLIVYLDPLVHIWPAGNPYHDSDWWSWIHYHWCISVHCTAAENWSEAAGPDAGKCQYAADWRNGEAGPEDYSGNPDF